MRCLHPAMRYPPSPRFALLFLATLPLSALPALMAQTEMSSAPNQTLTGRMREDLLKMNDFFDTMLPGTLSEHNIILKFTPKFSDLRDNEFVRYPFELRYGLTQKLELFGGMSP